MSWILAPPRPSKVYNLRNYLNMIKFSISLQRFNANLNLLKRYHTTLTMLYNKLEPVHMDRTETSLFKRREIAISPHHLNPLKYKKESWVHVFACNTNNEMEITAKQCRGQNPMKLINPLSIFPLNAIYALTL